MNPHKTEQDTTAYPQQDSEPGSTDDTPGLCFTQLLREWARADKMLEPPSKPPTAELSAEINSLSDEPLCLTLLLREAEQSPEGAENLEQYLRSRAGSSAAK